MAVIKVCAPDEHLRRARVPVVLAHDVGALGAPVLRAQHGCQSVVWVQKREARQTYLTVDHAGRRALERAVELELQTHRGVRTS